MKASVGRIVLYRSRSLLGYTIPALVTATVETIHPAGVKAGHVPPLTGDDHVHLHVFSPALPGDSPLRPVAGGGAASRVAIPARWGEWIPAPQQPDLRKQVETADRPAAPNVGGGYQEWDVPFFEWGPDVPVSLGLWTGPGAPPTGGKYLEQPLGTWAWPPRV